MSKKSLFRLAATFVSLLAATGAYAQSYSNAVMALNPAAYWPLTEATAPSDGLYVATNLGTLGAAGQGYYETWWQTNGATTAMFSSNSIAHIPGAIVGDSDTALQQGAVGQYIVIPRTTNGVPNPAVTLTPPFSIELWVYPTNGSSGQLKPILAEGFNNVHATNLNYVTSTRGTSIGMFSGFLYFNTFNNNGTKTEIDVPSGSLSLTLSNWYHVVATFDGTTMRVYTNGVLVRTASPPVDALGQRYAADPVSPLIIGGGNDLGLSGGANALFGGGIDEVAIYKTTLSAAQALAHYQNGTNSSRGTSYAATIGADSPAIYLRLDEPAFAGAAAPNTYPVANNYGTLGGAASGYYLPGSTPGVAGPAYTGFGGSSTAVALNGFNAGIDVSAGSLPPSLNPTNGQPITLAAWFKGNPSDVVGRFQTIVGHSDASWRLNLDNNAGPQFNPGNGPQLQFANVNDELLNGTYVNDGNWHFVAAVCDGTNDSMYVDGLLVKSGAAAGIVTNGSPLDIILGGDPQYTVPQPLPGTGGGGRWFNGSIAQVAIFTNALNATQIQGIFGAAGVPPSIRQQPASQALDAGTSASIPTIVAGSAPITYQWYKGGSLASGKTASALTFSSVATGDAGSYFLVASNASGSVTSSVITVTVFQPNTFASAVRALNPLAYWPLNESTQPPFGQYIATNIGSTSNTLTAYYESWYQPVTNGAANTFYPTNFILHTAGNTGDGDNAMLCDNANGAGQFVVIPRATNGVLNAAATITPPFTIECWVKTTNLTAGVRPIVNEGRNSVQTDASHGYTNTYKGFSLGQFQAKFYFQCYAGIANGNGPSPELDAVNLASNVWYHLVVTYDGTTATMYTNGVQADSKATGYQPDPVSPLLIGTGTFLPAGNGGNEFSGAVDDVAIYSGVLSLSQVQAHFAAASGATYATTVKSDNPSIYLRLDEPAFNSYPAYSTYPLATNYGTLGAAANGVYMPGTTPGVPGPAFAGFGSNSSSAVAINGFFGAVDIGAGITPAQLNPTGTQPLTLAAWFQGNPADAPGRFQEIVSHGNSSWRITLDNTNAGVRFNPGNNPEIQFINNADLVTNNAVLNDGNWHFVAGTSDGSSATMYIDGVPVRTNSGVGALAGTTVDALIGGNPQNITPSFNNANIRYFDGNIAQVSYFSNALSAPQIRQMYDAAGVPLSILQQPPTTVTNNVGSVVSIPAVVRGSSPVYQWYTSNTVTSVISPVSGQTNSALTFNPATLSNNGYYLLIATNAYNAVTSSVVQLVVVGPPQIVQSSPSDIRVFQGTAPTLHVTVIGPSPAFQWTSNSIVVGSAADLPISTATLGTSTYGCVITNSFGSTNITMNVTVMNDPVANYPAHVLADHPVAYFRLSETDNGSGNNGSTSYDFAGGNNGIYTNTLLGQPGYAPDIEPTNTAAEFGDFNGGVDDNFAGFVPNYLNFGTSNGANAQFSVEAWVQEYAFLNGGNCIVGMGTGNGGEQFVLDTGGSGASVRFFVRNAAGTSVGANAATIRIDDSQWHHMVGVCDEAGGHIYLYLDGVQVASAVLATNSGLQSTTVPLSIGARQSGNTGDYDFQFLGKINDVAIYPTALSQAQVQAHYLAGEVLPKISSISPTNQSVNVGGTATITVAATGSPTLAYQWFDQSFNVVGNGPTLTLTNLQTSQSGTYTVQVSNSYGMASTNAVITVNSGPPVISVDLQPANQTVFATTPVTLYVVVSGTPPFAYSWYRNGSPIAVSGPTNTFNALEGTNTYQVAVTNGFGGTISSMVTVIGYPVITLNPSNYTDNLKISFAGYNRGETLNDFPVLVRLSPALTGFNYAHFASPSGGDLRFTDASGTRVIPHEIDTWNTAGESTVWVQVPALSGPSDSIYAYWGNPSDTAAPVGTNVWVPPAFEGRPAFKLVYHLNQTALPTLDSAGQHDTVGGVNPAAGSGIVGAGRVFDGSTTYLDAGQIDLGDQFTLSSWVNINTNASNEQVLWRTKGGPTFAGDGFQVFVDQFQTADHELRIESGNGVSGSAAASAVGAVSFGQWHLVTSTLSHTNGKARLFLDGVDITVSSSFQADSSLTNPVTIGGNNLFLNGTLDEVRIQAGTNTVNWIWASYMTVAQNAALQSYSSVTSSVAVPVVLSNTVFQVVGNSLILSGSGGAGAAGKAYQVLTATNVLQPISQWAPVATNLFDGAGNFSATNAIDRTKPSRYFRIAVPQ